MVTNTCRAIGSDSKRSRLAKPTKRRGSLTSSPVEVKLITRAIKAGTSTDKLISTTAGSRNAQAERELRTDLSRTGPATLLRE